MFKSALDKQKLQEQLKKRELNLGEQSESKPQNFRLLSEAIKRVIESVLGTNHQRKIKKILR